MDKKLGFNKRVSLVKKEIREALENSELGNIKGTDTTGYHTLSSIYEHLNPLLDKYDLDLDLNIGHTEIIGLWIDCEGDSEKTREIVVDFTRIKDQKRLQLMANEVQSEGAVKTYTRRYALTTVLNLPSTDIIEGGNDYSGNKGNKTQEITRTDKEEREKNYFKACLMECCENDENRFGNELEKLTTFEGKDGKQVKGINDIEKLNPKRLKVTFDKFKKVYPDICKTVLDRARTEKAK